MLNIISIFLLLSGFFATLAKVQKKSKGSQYIAVFILGVSSIIISKNYVFLNEEVNQTLILLLVAALSVNFAIGEILKSKHNKLLLLFPLLTPLIFFFYPNLSQHSYLNFRIDSVNMLVLFALLGSCTPILINILQIGVNKLVNKLNITSYKETESNIVESALYYLFIGGVAALGNFLLGPISILIIATFLLSSSFFARQRLSISPHILLSASAALFLISAATILVQKSGFSSINMTNGEVIEGIFIAGFIVLIYELFSRLGQDSKGKKQIYLTCLAFVIPAITVVVVGFLYTQLERLGGMLSLTALLISLGLLSILYSSFKTESNLIGLKLTALGVTLLIMPIIMPVQQSSGIDLEGLGISPANEKSNSSSDELNYFQKLDIPNGQDLSLATGSWSINEEVSKVFFELGPKGGRTKGEFREVIGTFNIKDNAEESSIEVKMPVKKLTTFNSIRDTDLINEPEFFESSKYPEVTFVSKSFTPKGDGYEVKGDFTMKGVTKEESFDLKLVGVGEVDGKKVSVFWGFSSIDRTAYNMEPSAKIGDIVDFHFEVQLEKK